MNNVMCRRFLVIKISSSFSGPWRNPPCPVCGQINTCNTTNTHTHVALPDYPSWAEASSSLYLHPATGSTLHCRSLQDQRRNGREEESHKHTINWTTILLEHNDNLLIHIMVVFYFNRMLVPLTPQVILNRQFNHYWNRATVYYHNACWNNCQMIDAVPRNKFIEKLPGPSSPGYHSYH